MTARLTVLQVVHGYPPYDQAGTEVYTRTLSRALLARPGVEAVHVFARRGDPDAGEYTLEERELDGIHVHWVNYNYHSLHRQDALHQNAAIDSIFEALLERTGAHVVHVQHLIGLSTGIVEIARRRGIPVVFTLPDFWYQCIRGQRIDWRGDRCDSIDLSKCARCFWRKQAAYFVNAVRDRLHDEERSLPARLGSLPKLAVQTLREDAGRRPFERRRRDMNAMLRSASAIIGPSQFILDQYREFFDLEDTRLVHSDYGMETDWALDLVPRERPSGETHFGFVGTFLPTKGVDLLVEAFDSFHEPGVELHLYGRAPQHLQRFEEKLRLSTVNPSIHFHGPFENRELARVLGSIDVLVVPSIWFENSPLTLHEAALARIPVLTSDLGGMREFVEVHQNGLLFADRDVHDLREKIRQFIDDRELWSRLREPHQDIKTPAEDAEQIEALYRSVMKERPERKQPHTCE